jgi:carboxyl-terminal processing protease
MWARSRGARTWWARSTTATSLAAGLLLGGAAAAEDGLDRLTAALTRVAPSMPQLDEGALREACTSDLLCAARRVVAAWPDGARLEPVPHPDTEIIRLARTPRSVTLVRRTPDGVLRVRLDGFGRRAMQEVRAAVGLGARITALELDLRNNRGGSLRRMIEVAALFTGQHAGALRLVGHNGAVPLDLPPSTRAVRADRLDVLIGPETASSAEVLAALLRKHAGARLVGARSFGKDWAEQAFPIDHRWRLWLWAGHIRIEGETLAGGLRPDLDQARP